MFLFKIFGIFGFMTGPIIAAVVGGYGILKFYDMIKGMLFGGFSGTPADVARGGVFVSTVAAVTAATGVGKAKSKLRWVRRAFLLFGDEIESPKQDK